RHRSGSGESSNQRGRKTSSSSPFSLNRPGLPATKEETEQETHNRAQDGAGCREGHRISLDGVDHRIIQKIRAGVDGEHLPLPIVLHGGCGPAAVKVEAAAVGELIAFLSGATRDRKCTRIDLRHLVGLGLDTKVSEAQ